ncbi:MAG: hypothetical protein AB8B95_02150 [Pseudohongiellaceae bacterium]
MTDNRKMPVISTSFNRYLRAVSVALMLCGCANAQLPTLSEADYLWLGEQIYSNECNSRFECLTSWNKGEDFPSLGIGHFIWFQAGQEVPFEETFPQLLQALRTQAVALPSWIENLESFDSPWPDRTSFIADLESERMHELRAFLFESRHQQSEFIAQRLATTLPSLLSGVSASEGERIKKNFFTIANTSAPYGLYALIDYVHFKGSGVNPKERYSGEGWGLQQVLLEMGDKSDLGSFVSAAEVVLARRVENAPAERNEMRWLAGWKNRLKTYLPSLNSH